MRLEVRLWRYRLDTFHVRRSLADMFKTIDQHNGSPISWDFGFGFIENITSIGYLQEDTTNGTYQFSVHFDATGVSAGSGDVPFAVSGNVEPPVTIEPKEVPGLFITYSVTDWAPPGAASPDLSCNLSVSLEWKGNGGHQGPDPMFSSQHFSGHIVSKQFSEFAAKLKRLVEVQTAIGRATGLKL